MSLSVQVLVPADDMELVLEKIKKRESFVASLNTGGWADKQFTIINVPLDEYEVTTIEKDPDDPDEYYCFECTVTPVIPRSDSSSGERKLSPDL